MARWKVQEAKSRFSALLEKANEDGPQVIARHGKDRAVVLSVAEYKKLKSRRPDFKEWLLAIPKAGLRVRRRKERLRRAAF